METTARVRLLVEPLLEPAGVSLYDLEFNGGVLRITVEREGGVDIGVIGQLTRQISHLLDEADPLPGQYTLEVSSPGLERTLRTPEHYAGAVGSVVSLKLRPGAEGDRRLKGVLVAADADTASVEPAGTDPGTVRVIPLDDISRARTVFEWGPTPKPGSGGKPRAATSAPSAEKKAARS